MEKFFYTAIISLAFMHGYAQNTLGTFLPRANDEVTLQQTATVRALVSGTQGMLFLQQSQTSPAGSNHQLTLNCSALRSGEYVVYMNVNGQIICEFTNFR